MRREQVLTKTLFLSRLSISSTIVCVCFEFALGFASSTERTMASCAHPSAHESGKYTVISATHDQCLATCMSAPVLGCWVSWYVQAKTGRQARQATPARPRREAARRGSWQDVSPHFVGNGQCTASGGMWPPVLCVAGKHPQRLRCATAASVRAEQRQVLRARDHRHAEGQSRGQERQ
jgi:hypothetical protein